MMRVIFNAALIFAPALTYGQSLQLPYPLPKSLTQGNGDSSVVKISQDTAITFATATESALFMGIATRYEQLIQNKVSSTFAISNDDNVTSTLSSVVISLDSVDEKLGSSTCENYTLTVSSDSATISSCSIYGARHALETFTQLIRADGLGRIYGALPITVVDSPAYEYRALMIDSGRHYLPVSTIKKAINGMAAMKMNVLHWHIFDSTSFPVQSELFPQLSEKGAYAKGAVYTLEDMGDVVAFAKSRGVRVVPEFEMPGHGAFNKGMPELSLTSCTDVLDPTKNSTYEFIIAFLDEMGTVFEDRILMLGGDEVGLDANCQWEGAGCGYHCYDKDEDVVEWMGAMGLNSSQVTGYFWQQIRDYVIPNLKDNEGKKVMVWVADEGNDGGLWPPPLMSDLPVGSIANVYQSIGAAASYLDGGVPVVLSVAGSDWYLDYFPNFEAVYSVRPCDELDCAGNPERGEMILGGQVSMWGEGVGAINFDDKVWVGTSALAERLWTDLPLGDNHTATSMEAEARHHSLSCHWSHWGMPTLTRVANGVNSVEIDSPTIYGLQPNFMTCGNDWSSVPE